MGVTHKPHNWRRRKGDGYEYAFACDTNRMRGELAPASAADIDHLASLFERATKSKLPPAIGDVERGAA